MDKVRVSHHGEEVEIPAGSAVLLFRSKRRGDLGTSPGTRLNMYGIIRMVLQSEVPNYSTELEDRFRLRHDWTIRNICMDIEDLFGNNVA